MIRLKNNDKIKEVEKTPTPPGQTQGNSTLRPEVVNAKVYKLKSAFVKNAVFITLSYVDTNNGRKPIEIFINSKDLNRSAEYVVLTRLISAIFRRATDPRFILEELHGIIDPNGGSFKDGKYFHGASAIYTICSEIKEPSDKLFKSLLFIKEQIASTFSFSFPLFGFNSILIPKILFEQKLNTSSKDGG